MVSKEVGHFGRAVRNKQNQLLRSLAGEEGPALVYRPTNILSVTPLSISLCMYFAILQFNPIIFVVIVYQTQNVLIKIHIAVVQPKKH